jgi:oxygen-independent coproporphyrinogen-3 oxidase
MTRIAPDLLRKYGAQGPRYTSYPTVPCWDSTPTEAQWLGHLDAALATSPPQGAALYVHVPFCHALCTFCGCNMRVTRNHALVAPYLASVLREQRTLLDRLGRSTLPLGEVYVGGGTPTYLHAEELDQLLSGLFAHATLTPGASLTLEADPRITQAAHLAVLRRHGFDRLSLGVQDFDARVQDIVNRTQSEQQVREVTDAARSLGFRTISYDLIHGLPLQTRDSIDATFDEAEIVYAPELWRIKGEIACAEVAGDDADARARGTAEARRCFETGIALAVSHGTVLFELRSRAALARLLGGAEGSREALEKVHRI